MAEQIEGIKVASEKAVEDYRTSKAFKDEIIESTLDMFLSIFDECQKQV